MKNIVFCADGTWNRPGTPDDSDQPAYSTNVFKLFSHLAGAYDDDSIALDNEQERTDRDSAGAVIQAGKYIHGVGDSDNPLIKVLGGAVGMGVIARIVRGYTFVSRNYVAGDRIFLIGFSRGAYTVRALADLIEKKGLLDAAKLPLASDKEQAYRLGSAVWYDYQVERLSDCGVDSLLGLLADMAMVLPAFLSAPATDARTPPVAIASVAVWDTVGSLGIPDYTSAGSVADLFRFADTRLGPGVHTAFQAFARDEVRANFSPTLWDDDPRIRQLQFAGAHSDVGGGNPIAGDESGLSDIALGWMIDNLTGAGVSFSGAWQRAPRPDPAGVAHMPWRYPPYDVLPQGPRFFPPYVHEHPSVAARRAAGPVVPDPGLAPVPYV